MGGQRGPSCAAAICCTAFELGLQKCTSRTVLELTSCDFRAGVAEVDFALLSYTKKTLGLSSRSAELYVAYVCTNTDFQTGFLRIPHLWWFESNQQETRRSPCWRAPPPTLTQTTQLSSNLHPPRPESTEWRERGFELSPAARLVASVSRVLVLCLVAIHWLACVWFAVGVAQARPAGCRRCFLKRSGVGNVGMEIVFVLLTQTQSSKPRAPRASVQPRRRS